MMKKDTNWNKQKILITFLKIFAVYFLNFSKFDKIKEYVLTFISIWIIFCLCINIPKCPKHTEILLYVWAHITKNKPLK
jgi:hypothetical protein